MSDDATDVRCENWSTSWRFVSGFVKWRDMQLLCLYLSPDTLSDTFHCAPCHFTNIGCHAVTNRHILMSSWHSQTIVIAYPRPAMKIHWWLLHTQFQSCPQTIFPMFVNFRLPASCLLVNIMSLCHGTITNVSCSFFFAIMSDKQIIIFNSIPAAAWHFSAKWHMTKTGDTFCIG